METCRSQPPSAATGQQVRVHKSYHLLHYYIQLSCNQPNIRSYSQLDRSPTKGVPSKQEPTKPRVRLGYDSPEKKNSSLLEQFIQSYYAT